MKIFNFVKEVAQMQRTICEYQRLVGDIVIALKRPEHTSILHNIDEARWIFEQIKLLHEKAKPSD